MLLGSIRASASRSLLMSAGSVLPVVTFNLRFSSAVIGPSWWLRFCGLMIALIDFERMAQQEKDGICEPPCFTGATRDLYAGKPYREVALNLDSREKL